MKTPIRVVVVDDSPFVCGLLARQLRSATGMDVVGIAHDGRRAVDLVKELRPDAVTLDLEMPGVGGLEVLERVMHECPTPVVLVSGVSQQAAAVTVRALQRGAVDFVLKYVPGVDTNPDELRGEIVAKVRVAARVKVVRSLSGGRSGLVRVKPREPRPVPGPALDGVVVVGASTGGPRALRDLLGGLPAGFPAAVVVVQHMPAAFTGALAAQLDRQVPLAVREASAGDRLRPGEVLVARGDHHLMLRPDGRVELPCGDREGGGHCPSIDVTMRSAAEVFGARAHGVVLTGMGGDGALGLLAIRTKGGRTFAQDEASCVINGMPQRAIDQGAVERVAGPAEIAALLRRCLPGTGEE